MSETSELPVVGAHNPTPDSAWFRYRNGILHADGVSLESIARDHGTPCFVYAGGAIDASIRSINDALSFVDHRVAYAVKANGNLQLLARIRAHGCGADIVSGGELERALKAGFEPTSIIFSGVGKTSEELQRAIDVGVRAIHLESEAELDAVIEVAKQAGRSVELGVRVNPNVDPQTHPYISTGLHHSKFGISLERARVLLPKVLASPHVFLGTIACHIGSQLGSAEPLREAVEIVGAFAIEALNAGHPLRAIDVGGGWPMHYGHEAAPYPPHAAFGEAVKQGLEASGVFDHVRNSGTNLTVFTEPGRSIVGDAGVLLTRVVYTKEQGDTRFVIVDAAMTELIRPALYAAYHAIMPCTQPSSDTPMVTQSVVGPVCESGDFFAKGRELPELRCNDLIALRGAGAYARELQSMYNARRLPPEILVDGEASRIIRRRPDVSSLWLGEADT